MSRAKIPESILHHPVRKYMRRKFMRILPRMEHRALLELVHHNLILSPSLSSSDEGGLSPFDAVRLPSTRPVAQLLSRTLFCHTGEQIMEPDLLIRDTLGVLPRLTETVATELSIDANEVKPCVVARMFLLDVGLDTLGRFSD